MVKRFFSLLIGCAALSGICPPLRADTVVLKSGKTVEGEVLSEEEDAITIKTAAGKLTIKQSDIKSLQRRKAAAPTPASAPAAPPSTEAAEAVEKAAHLAETSTPEEAFKAYQKAALLFDDVDMHRRIARAYFNRAERIKAELKPQLEAAAMTWDTAREAAMEERRSLVNGKFKKFNPNNPKYKEATQKYGDLLKKAEVALDLLANAQLAFTAVLRHKRQTDFEAAACQALCLVDNTEINTRVRCRKLLVAFLAEYKPSSDRERALYAQCKEELERMSK